MKSAPNYILLFTGLLVVLIISFILDLLLGSIDIPLRELSAILTSGDSSSEIYREILLNYRLPKAITALLTGASLSVAGLLMQTLFRNPLADPYILGVSSGAGLGVAITMMSAAILPSFWITGSWGIILSAVTGGTLVLLLVILVSFRLQNTVSY